MMFRLSFTCSKSKRLVALPLGERSKISYQLVEVLPQLMVTLRRGALSNFTLPPRDTGDCSNQKKGRNPYELSPRPCSHMTEKQGLSGKMVIDLSDLFLVTLATSCITDKTKNIYMHKAFCIFVVTSLDRYDYSQTYGIVQNQRKAHSATKKIRFLGAVCVKVGFVAKQATNMVRQMGRSRLKAISRLTSSQFATRGITKQIPMAQKNSLVFFCGMRRLRVQQTSNEQAILMARMKTVQMCPIISQAKTKMLQKNLTIDHKMENAQGIMEKTKEKNWTIKLLAGAVGIFYACSIGV